MKDIKSNLRFEHYIVDYVDFRNNSEFEGEETSLEFKPRAKFHIENNDLLVFLSVDIFKDAVKHNYPFEMSVGVVGYFTISNQEDIEKYKTNAVAVLFPYVRSIISTYTAIANVNPLILPTVNINRMLADQE